MGGQDEVEMSVAEARAAWAEVLNAAIRGRTTWITNRGRRIAAVVPLGVAEEGTRPAQQRD